MLRFVASLFTSNTKPTNITDTITFEENLQETVIEVTTTEIEEVSNPLTTEAENSNDIFNETISEEAELSEEDISLIHSLRQQQKQELIQKILLRRIAHQAIMNHYAQDHIPLSQIQEKLEEDNLPLKVLQEKLKKRNNVSIYTTTKENINFLLYNNKSLLAQLRKSKRNSNTLIKNDTPKDDRDYDVWDDAIIGRLMNLIDTIGMETEDTIGMEKENTIGMKTIQEESSEEIARETTPKVEGDLAKEIIKEAIKRMEKEVAKEMEKEVAREMEKEVAREMKKEAEREMKKKVEREMEKEREREMKKEMEKIAKEKEIPVVVKVEEKELSKEIVKEVVKEEDSDNESYTFSEESADDDDDNETIIAESSSVVENDILEKKCESVIIAEEIINFGETINVAESLTISSNKSSVKNILVNKRSSRTKIDSGYGENSISTNINVNAKRENRFLGRNRSMLSLRQSSLININNNKTIPKNSPNSPISESSIKSRNNLDRKSSIHSKKSYDNVSRRSSISSKFSINTINTINTTAGAITEEPNEDDFDDTNFRNKFFTAPKRTSQKSNKSLHFLRNLWKSNQSPDENLTNKEIMEKYYQQDDDAKSNHHANLQQSKEGTNTNEIDEENSDQGYSNFYLAMPNGKWMVRTRTGSRKITGTQYVDKEFI